MNPLSKLPETLLRVRVRKLFLCGLDRFRWQGERLPDPFSVSAAVMMTASTYQRGSSDE
ncbi:MAG: hypothetical protein AAF402_01965 [Pseudomonadota bacterium]